MLNLTLATWPGQADSAFGRQNATNFPTFASMVKCVRSPTQAVAGGSIRIQPFSKARCDTKGTALVCPLSAHAVVRSSRPVHPGVKQIQRRPIRSWIAFTVTLTGNKAITAGVYSRQRSDGIYKGLTGRPGERQAHSRPREYALRAGPERARILRVSRNGNPPREPMSSSQG